MSQVDENKQGSVARGTYDFKGWKPYVENWIKGKVERVFARKPSHAVPCPDIPGVQIYKYLDLHLLNTTQKKIVFPGRRDKPVRFDAFYAHSDWDDLVDVRFDSHPTPDPTQTTGKYWPRGFSLFYFNTDDPLFDIQ